jgi:hypothetical protein
MKVEIKGGNLIITIPVNKKPVPSGTGKTLIVASSRGNKETEAVVQGQNVVVGLNAYIYANPR